MTLVQHFFRKVLNITTGRDSLAIVSNMWQEENLDIFLVHWLVGINSKKCQKSVKIFVLVETVAHFTL